MRLAWATDIHLNFVSEEHTRDVFCQQLLEAAPDAIVLTGDIAEAPSVERWLRFLADVLAPRPIYFVLGNHDYYHGTIANVRIAMRRMVAEVPRLHWMGAGGAVRLSEDTMMVGHSGWGDGVHGDFLDTPIRLNDHLLIRELAGLHRGILLSRLRALGEEAADVLRAGIQEALGVGARQVLVLTHVPPYPATCWHEGATPAPDSPWLPDFTCGAVGAMLNAQAAARPDVSFVVLCGHSHGEGVTQIAANLEVRTGGAAYGAPALAGVLDY